MAEKIDLLIKKMTLEEKASLCSGENFWETKAVERLDIPPIMVADGPHGLRVVDPDGLGESRKASCFPTASALASSWDRDLIAEVGTALVEECKEQGVDILLGPGVNIKRTPLCGRNFEYFSEDPYLAGELGVSYVQSVQEQGVGTSLKHFAANNQEYRRFSINARIGERALREIYLPAFEKIIKEAQPWTVMCAYNRINGDFGSEHKYLLTDILKKEWGFEGFVVSDWGAVHDRVKGAAAGLDLEMPGPAPLNDQKLVNAVENGDLDEEVLDDISRRILQVIFKARKSNDSENQNLENMNDELFEEHYQIARKAAQESMVLLKNDHQLLPLNPEKIKTLAVIGKIAEQPRFEGGGSSKVNAFKVDIPLEEIKKAAGNSVDIEYTAGYTLDQNEQNLGQENSEEIDRELIKKAVKAAHKADTVVIFAGTTEKIESEGYDRGNLQLPLNQIKVIKAVSEVSDRVIVVLSNGSAVAIDSWLNDVDALLEAWLAGEASGGAVSDILFGRTNPCGRLAETFPLRLQDTPAYINYPGNHEEVNYGEGIYVGYRYYDKKEIEPLFPFGYGLSYTTFAYNNLRINKSKAAVNSNNKGKTAEVKINIKNTGKMAGKEVVQLYIEPQDSSIDRPVKELKGFIKVYLEPGEEKELSFILNRRDFAYYNCEKNRWIAEKGNYIIQIGRSSRDIVLKEDFFLEEGEEHDRVLTEITPVDDWLEDPRGYEILKSILTKKQLARLNDEDFFIIRDKPIYRLAAFSKGEVRQEQVDKILEHIN